MSYQLRIVTSYVSPLNLKIFPENGYLPIFIIRSIHNSSLIGKYSGTVVHMKELSPSSELFRAKKYGLIDRECHRSVLRDLLNDTGLLSNHVVELIV